VVLFRVWIYAVFTLWAFFICLVTVPVIIGLSVVMSKMWGWQCKCVNGQVAGYKGSV